MDDGLVLQTIGGETRAFRFAEGLLADLGVWRRLQPLPGDLYLSRVARIEPALGLAFCELGEGPAGVLPLDQAPAGLTEGAAQPVSLQRAAAPGKGPKLAPARVPAAWREGPAPRLLERRADPLARFLVLEPEAVLIDSPELAGELRRRGLAPQLVPGGFSGALAGQLEAEVEALLEPRVALPGGGSLLIEPGETLTAIDLNLGSAGRGQAARAAEAFNRQALPEIARQLRLRSLAGRILLDCLSLPGLRERSALADALAEAVAADPETVRVVGVTRSGLVELTRRRGLLAPLHELLTEPAARRPTLETEAARLLRRLAALQREAPGRPLSLQLDPALERRLEALEDWRVARQAAGALLSVAPLPEAPGLARYRLDRTG